MPEFVGRRRRRGKKESSMRPSMDGNVRQTLASKLGVSWAQHAPQRERWQGPEGGRAIQRWVALWYARIFKNRNKQLRMEIIRCITASTGDCLVLVGQQPKRRKEKRLVMSCRAAVLALGMMTPYDVSRRTRRTN